MWESGFRQRQGVRRLLQTKPLPHIENIGAFTVGAFISASINPPLRLLTCIAPLTIFDQLNLTKFSMDLKRGEPLATKNRYNILSIFCFAYNSFDS